MILNLAYPEKSEIKFKISKFPDGQQQVTILTDSKFMEDFDITIKSRLKNFLDLELIICAAKSIRSLFNGKKGIRLYISYFLGARSDRQFTAGENNYLKDVICPIINSLEFESVTVLDPHSNCLEMGLINFQKEDNVDIVKFALGEIYDHDSNYGNSNMILISPDAGATHKIYKVAEEIGFGGDIFTCSKERDKLGKLSKCVVPDTTKNYDVSTKPKDYIIIDDICDGGKTFINIAEEIKKQWLNPDGIKIYLIVTHGIFSSVSNLVKMYQEDLFTGIYCSNSYSDNPKGDYGLDNGGPSVKDYIKQLNVF